MATTYRPDDTYFAVPVDPPPIRESSSAPRALARGLIALGVVLRLIAYADRRPLWMDELMLSLNVGARSFPGLARPLDYGQTAPILFLWSQRLLTRVGGMNEWTLRALPLAFGLALLPLLWLAGRRLLGERAALVALVLAVLSQPLIYYASEAKQYAGDAFFTAALLAATVRVLDAPSDSRPWWYLASAGVLAAGFSQPAVFVLCAVLAALVLAPGVRRVPGWQARIALLAGTWAALSAVLYLVIYRAAAANPFMRRVWSAVFLTPGAPDLGERLRYSAREILLHGILPVWPGASPRELWLGVAAYVLGVLALWLRPQGRRGRAVAALLTLPLAGVLAASALGLYPVAVRLALFLTPVVFLAYGAAASELVEALPRASRRARDAACALVVLALVWWRFADVRAAAIEPRRYEDSRDVIGDYMRRASPDPVYVYWGGVPSWAFYTTDWSAPDTSRLAWLARAGAQDSPPFEVRRRAPHAEAPIGAELVFDDHDHLELVGLPTGPEFRERVHGPTSAVDPEWADNEIRRLRAAVDARPTRTGYAWVYLAHHGAEIRAALTDAIRRAGGRVVVVYSGDAVALLRVAFHSPAHDEGTVDDSEGCCDAIESPRGVAED